MASINPILIGSSGRLTLLLSTTPDYYVFRNRSDSTRTIANTISGPLLSHALSGGNNNSIQTNFSKVRTKIYKKIPTHNNQFVKLTPASAQKGLKRYDSFAFPIGSAMQDVIRIAKWSKSGNGLLFYGKQFLLQRSAAFDETSSYNFASVLMSTARPISLGLIKPVARHVSKDGGFLMGMVSALGFAGPPVYKAPAGTAGSYVRGGNYPTYAIVKSDMGHGLIRAKTGMSARQRLLQIYGPATKKKKVGFLAGLMGALKGMLTFSNPNQFKGLTDTEKVVTYRADQDAQQMMERYHKDKAMQNLNLYQNYIQRYKLDNTDISYYRAAGESPKGLYTYDNTFNSYGKNKNLSAIEEMYDLMVTGQLPTNSDWSKSSPQNKNFNYTQGIVHGESVKIDGSLGNEIDSGHVNKLNLRDIKMWPTVMATKYHNIVRDGVESVIIRNETSRVLNTYKGKGFSTSYTEDTIGIEAVQDSTFKDANNKDKDQIAFWFHDVVNNKYIRFRSTVKGISDNESVDWEEIKYLGKPDSVYNYKGYSRSLSFSFTVAITSIKELHPTWAKINYLKSMSRPADYSHGQFVVPPLINLRIGDIYYNVPIIMQSINMTVPDDATWETLPNGEGLYEYLGGKISIPDIRWGQYPTMVDISITAYILEKEMFPRIGCTVFGSNQYDSIDKDFSLRDVNNKSIENGILTSERRDPKEYTKITESKRAKKQAEIAAAEAKQRADAAAAKVAASNFSSGAMAKSPSGGFVEPQPLFGGGMAATNSSFAPTPFE